MARKRVLYFIYSLDQGGAERQLAELIRNLDLARFEPFLAVHNATDRLAYTLPSGAPHVVDHRLGSLSSYRSLSALVKTLEPDILHSYMGAENIVGRLMKRVRPGLKVISSVRCMQLPRGYIAAERLTHTLADRIVVNSVGIRDELVARAGVPAGRIDVIENGVDLGRFRPLGEGERADARREHAMDGTRTLVLPGRVSTQKNHAAVLDALASLKSQDALPGDLRVVFAGRDYPPWYGTMLRAKASRAGLDGVVRWTGVVRAIERLVAASDGVLLPSQYEGLPNAVIEAMACGVLALVSPPANVDALVTDGREGLVARDVSAAAVETVLRRYLALTAEERAAMGAAGHAHATERFAVERMAQRTMALYHAL